MAKQFINIGTGEQLHNWIITTNDNPKTIEFIEVEGDGIKMIDSSHIAIDYNPTKDMVIVNSEIGRYELTKDTVSSVDAAAIVTDLDLYNNLKSGLYGA